MNFPESLLQPAELSRAALRACLKQPPGVVALLRRPLVYGAATVIALPVIQEPEADPTLGRTLLAGSVGAPRIHGAFVHHDLAVKFGVAVRTGDGPGAKLGSEAFFSHVDIPQKGVNLVKILIGITIYTSWGENPAKQKKGKQVDKFLTIKEVAAHLRLSLQSVKRLIEDGRLAAHKIGRSSYRIPEGAVKALLTQSLTKVSVDAFESALKIEKEEGHHD
jgi:excisionase family DNA binding protein